MFLRRQDQAGGFPFGRVGGGVDEIFIVLHYKGCSSCLICEFTDLCDKPIKLMELVQQFITVPGVWLWGE